MSCEQRLSVAGSIASKLHTEFCRRAHRARKLGCRSRGITFLASLADSPVWVRQRSSAKAYLRLLQPDGRSTDETKCLHSRLARGRLMSVEHVVKAITMQGAAPAKTA